MLDRTPLRDRAKGRWRDILTALGVDNRYLTGKHGPCPMCEGKDRWRWDNKQGDGTWICSHCGAGAGTELVMRTKGCDFAEAARLVETVIGKARPESQRPVQSDGAKRAAMNTLWRAAQPVTVSSPAGRYLNSRLGLTEFPPCLRYVDSLPHKPSGKSFPAMVAMITAPDGKASILHRTFLDGKGGKAPVEQARMMMPGTVTPGSAIRLAKPAERMGVAEGIETAFAASILFGIPVWAAVNSSMLAAWIPPDEAKQIVVFGDSDSKFAGQYRAYSLAHRLATREMLVEVKIPSEIGSDWADVLTAKSKILEAV